VAKTRRSVKKRSVKSAKRAVSPRPKTSKKTGVRKAVRKPAASTDTPPRVLQLKKLREEFGLVLSVLSTRQARYAGDTSRLDDTRRRISQWMTDIDDICTPEAQEICGPDMAFPLP
jgi:hypothetical protein